MKKGTFFSKQQESGGQDKLNNQKGFTLTEVIIALAIGGVVLLTVLSAFQRKWADIRVDDEIKHLAESFSNIQRHHFNSANYNGLTNTIAVSYNLVEDKFATPPSTITNRMSGSVTLAAATTNTADDSFTWTTTAWPSKECKGIVKAVAPQIIAASVGGTTVKAAGGTLNLTTLATQCDAAASNSIVYTVGK